MRMATGRRMICLFAGSLAPVHPDAKIYAVKCSLPGATVGALRCGHSPTRVPGAGPARNLRRFL